MISKYIFALLFGSIFLSSKNTFGQIAPDSAINIGNECYKERFTSEDGEVVFKRITLPASFKGGDAPFLEFLMKSIKIGRIVEALPKYTKSYTDTASVMFIIDRHGQLSDLTVSGATNEAYKQELIKAFKASACFWEPGDNSGRKVNGWTHFKVYYSYERRAKNIAINISYDMLEP